MSFDQTKIIIAAETNVNNKQNNISIKYQCKRSDNLPQGIPRPSPALATDSSARMLTITQPTITHQHLVVVCGRLTTNPHPKSIHKCGAILYGAAHRISGTADIFWASRCSNQRRRCPLVSGSARASAVAAQAPKAQAIARARLHCQ